jgi:hypothetical protein
MKRSTPFSRQTADLSESLHRQLNMYAFAASAAGVGVLALTQPVEAKIVYTPAHHVIGPHHSYTIDLNHDKVTDFTISNSATCNDGTCFYGLYLVPPAGNSGVGYVLFGQLGLQSALRPGSGIGPNKHFQNGGALVWLEVFAGSTDTFGPWPNVKNRYLGLKFQIKGKTHYGWARLSVTRKGHIVTGTLTGYAYETIPNKAIIAGKTTGPDHAGVEESNVLTVRTPGRAGRTCIRSAWTFGLATTGINSQCSNSAAGLLFCKHLHR